MTTENKEQPALKEINKEETSSVPSSTDEISLIDLILILWRGKWIVGGCIILATIAGIFNAMMTPEVFSTTSIFVTKTGSKNNGNLSQLASLAGINFGNNSNIDPADYLDKVVEGKSFIGELLEKPWIINGDTTSLVKILKIEVDTLRFIFARERLTKKIDAIRNARIVMVQKDQRTGLSVLSTFGPDRNLVYELNVFILDYFSRYLRSSIKTQAHEKRSFIEKRISETKILLEASEDSLARFKASNLMTRSYQLMLVESRLARNVAINQEVYMQLQKQYELAKIEELDDQTLIQVIKDPEVALTRSKPKRKMIVLMYCLTGFFIGILGSISLQAGRTLVRKGRPRRQV